MNEMLINIMSVIVTVVVLPLLTICGTSFITWLKSKIKNEEALNHITTATEIIINSVKTVLQTYVDSLKKSGTFDEKAQIEAFTIARDLTLSQMTDGTKNYINETYGDLDNWLKIQIESCINTLKKV